jgi:hypothetical protein
MGYNNQRFLWLVQEIKAITQIPKNTADSVMLKLFSGDAGQIPT